MGRRKITKKPNPRKAACVNAIDEETLALMPKAAIDQRKKPQINLQKFGEMYDF